MSNDESNWKIVVYESQRSHELELNRATAAFEHAVLAPLFLLNGGAAVAFLTLLGADSTLTVDADLSKWAIGMWAAGLLMATWAVGFGYSSQRRFTMAVSLRRQLMEHKLPACDEDFRAVLTPLPSMKDAQPLGKDDPRPIHDKAKELQRTWMAFSALSSMFFLAGVVVAAWAVLD